MGDRQKKNGDPTADLDRYIDEMKMRGESELEDETLQRLIFSPGGSAVMKEVKREERKKEENAGYEDEFSDALEFIREDLKNFRSKDSTTEDEEIFSDARSHLDTPSISSPYSVYSPSIKGSVDPLSPNTSYATDKMSRVSLQSPSHPSSSILRPPYYPSNGQGVIPPHLSPMPAHLHSPINQHIPSPINYKHHIHSPHQQPLTPSVPNGSYLSTAPVPYPPQMSSSPYTPQSMPLPPTISHKTSPFKNVNGMSSSSSAINPLFSPYPNNPYPNSQSSYPPMQYPNCAPNIQQQRATEVQRSQMEMARFLSQQQQMTARMISQHPSQMQPQRQIEESKHRHDQVSPSRECKPSTSSVHLAYQSSVANYNSMNTGYYPDEYVRVKEEMEEKLEQYEKERRAAKRERRRQRRAAIAKLSPEQLEEFMKTVNIKKLKSKMIKAFGGYREDGDGNIMPPEREGGRLFTYKGDPRFPMPEGKDMSFYVKPDPDKPSAKKENKFITVKALKYVDQVPTCKEGREKPLLCRGHSNTKEREENPTLFGTKYLQKIQSLFHSLTGDPARVPNASTNGEKWENPLKDGVIPIGMEVYRDVKGRVWNPDYDYTPVFQQLVKAADELSIINIDSPPPSPPRHRSQSRIRMEKMNSHILSIDDMPENGNVFEWRRESDLSDYESDEADYGGDGRIAVGREELKRVEEERRGRGKSIKKEEENDDEAKKDKQVLIRDETKKIHNGYYPLLKSGKYWGIITYYEKSFEVGDPFFALHNFSKVFVEPHDEKKIGNPDKYYLSSFDRLDRDNKTSTVLQQQNMAFHFRCEPGGYLILCSESVPTLFVQSPLYNAMMGEELDTIVRITKGHELIIFDENFFNLLLQQAYQYGDKVMYELKELLMTRVSSTKGWGEAYVKSSILEALVWVEFNVVNAMDKIDTLMRGSRVIPCRPKVQLTAGYEEMLHFLFVRCRSRR